MILPALVEGLGEWAGGMDAKWRDTVVPLVENADLDDATRAEMLERIERLEYATVAEGQLERLKERLTGDLADRMAGRLTRENNWAATQRRQMSQDPFTAYRRTHDDLRYEVDRYLLNMAYRTDVERALGRAQDANDELRAAESDR